MTFLRDAAESAVRFVFPTFAEKQQSSSPHSHVSSTQSARAMPSTVHGETGSAEHRNSLLNGAGAQEDRAIQIEDDVETSPVRVTNKEIIRPETLKGALEYIEPRYKPQKNDLPPIAMAEYFDSRNLAERLQRSIESGDSEQEEARLAGLSLYVSPSLPASRILNDHSSPTPADAVLVADPMANKNFIQRGGPLRGPINTMNGNRDLSTSKAHFMAQNTRKGLNFPSSRTEEKFRTGSDFRENNHNQPSKRPRTGSSPLTKGSKQQPIQLDDSQEAVPPGTITSKAVRLTTPGQRNQAGLSKHEQRLKHGDLIEGKPVQFPSRHTTSTTSFPDTALEQQPIGQAHASTPIVHDSDDEEGFIKEATAERRQRERQKLLASSPLREPDPAQDDEVSRHFNASGALAKRASRTGVLAHTTPKKAVLKSYDESESPDELSTMRTTSHEPPAKAEKPSIMSNNGRVDGRSSSKAKAVKHPTQQPALKASEKDEELAVYPLRQFKYGQFPQSGGYALVVRMNPPMFEVNYQDTQLSVDPVVQPLPLGKITKVFYSIDGAFMALQMSKSGNLASIMFLEFRSEKDRYSFEMMLTNHDGTIKPYHREKELCEKWFASSNNDVADVAQEAKPPSRLHTTQHVATLPSTKERPSARRLRLVDGLDAPARAQQHPRLPNRNKASTEADGSSADMCAERSPTRLSSITTRARSRKNDVHDVDQDLTSAKTKFSSTGGLGPEWSTPLTYPKSGKKREIVEFNDLWRLDDDEFLNDSIVGLFMRYLEACLQERDPELAKRVYFFNSYFYESLNKNTKRSAEINYEAVSKWTRTIDLFSRDYIVVPVNENYHWFMAIICNLSYFTKDRNVDTEIIEDHTSPTSAAYDDHTVGVPESSAQPEQNNNGEAAEETRESFEEMSLIEKQKVLDVTGNDFTTPTLKDDTAKRQSRGKQRSKRRSLPKYDVAKPAILILDSLGISRSVTISALKQYIVREAKEKRSWDIDVSNIRGMNVPGIPQQANYSDCGLYVTMYLEQFVADPTPFVQRILQRQSTQGWPKTIRGHDLRNRLRELILELHKQQEGQGSDAIIPEVGQILIDPVPVEKAETDTIDTHDTPKAKLQEVQDAHKWWQTRSQQKQESPASPSRPALPTTDHVQETGTVSITNGDSPQETIVVEDESQVQVANDNQHDSPREFAKMLAQRRSPVKNATQSGQLENNITDGTESNVAAKEATSPQEATVAADSEPDEVPETQDDDMLL